MSVLRDVGYQRYDGPRTPLGSRWRPVLAHSLRASLRGGWVIALLILSGFITLVWGAILVSKAMGFVQASDVPGGGAQATDPSHYVFLFLARWYGAPLLGFLVALFAGGGAVADDARAGAFQFYFARPLSRDQYLAGKVGAVAITVALVTLAPALVLAGLRVGVALAMTRGEGWRTLACLGQAAALGLVETAALAAPAVALSSLSRGRGLAQGAFAALFLLPWVVGEIFVWIFRSPWPALLSIPAHLDAIGSRLFAIPVEERALPWVAALAMAVALVGGSIALLRARLASVEVIAP